MLVLNCENIGIIRLNSVMEGSVSMMVVSFISGLVSQCICMIRMFSGMLMVMVRFIVMFISLRCCRVRLRMLCQFDCRYWKMFMIFFLDQVGLFQEVGCYFGYWFLVDVDVFVQLGYGGCVDFGGQGV